MKKDGFFCPHCGEPLIRSSQQFITCPMACGKLNKAPDGFDASAKKALKLVPWPDDTPSAAHVNGGWYKLSFLEGDFRRVLTKTVDGKKECIQAEVCPQDCVVAILEDVPQVFRRSKHGRRERVIKHEKLVAQVESEDQPF